MLQKEVVDKIYTALIEHYPAFSPLEGRSSFELIITALIKEGTRWSSVTAALDKLQAFPIPTRLAALHFDTLQKLLSTCANPNRAALRVKTAMPRLMTWGFSPMDYANYTIDDLRRLLMNSITGEKGVIDFILLFVLDRDVIIADEDVQKILFRVCPDDELKTADYDALAAALKPILPENSSDYRLFYLLLSHLAREHCADKNPACRTCPLIHMCASVGEF